MISPLAYIHPEAQIGENVEIAPFVYIDKNVVIGDNNKIMPNVNILYGARIGNGNTIFPGAATTTSSARTSPSTAAQPPRVRR